MKTKLLRTAIFAAAALTMGALASPTMADVKYTFGTVSGGSYCDGITISSSDNVTYSGTHTGCTAGDSAGGFKAAIMTVGDYIDINTTDSTNAPGFFFTFLLDRKASTWYLYTNEGNGFQLINEGVLVMGMPASPKVGAKASTFKNAEAVDKPFS